MAKLATERNFLGIALKMGQSLYHLVTVLMQEQIVGNNTPSIHFFLALIVFGHISRKTQKTTKTVLMLCCVKTVDPTVKCTVFTERVFSMSKYYLANVAATTFFWLKNMFLNKKVHKLYSIFPLHSDICYPRKSNYSSHHFAILLLNKQKSHICSQNEACSRLI